MSIGLPSIEDAVRIKPQGLYAPDDHDNAAKGFGGIPVGTGLLGDLLRVPIDWILEIHQNGALVTAISLPNKPSVMDVARPGSDKVDHTFSGAVKQPTEPRTLKVMFGGRTGVMPRTGYNRFGEIIFKDPLFILSEFDAFLARFSDMSRREELYLDPDAYASGAVVELVLRSLTERIHVKCVVEEWHWRKDANETRLSASWDLKLFGYAPAIAENPQNILGPVADVALYAAEMIDLMNAAIAAGDNILINTHRDLEVLRAPFEALKRSTTVINNFAASFRSLAAFPRELAADAWEALTTFADTLIGLPVDLADGLLEGLGFDLVDEHAGHGHGQGIEPDETSANLLDLVTVTQEAQIRAVEVCGLTGGGPRERDAARSRRESGGSDYTREGAQDPSRILGERRSTDGVRVYAIQPGDSPASIESRYLPHGATWAQVMALNGLSAPFADDLGRPLEVGDRILLPARGTAGRLPYGIGAGGEVDLSAAFGRDFYLSPDGEWELTADGRDVRQAWGEALFEQAITKRLRTPQGTSGAFRAYGLVPVTGTKVTPSKVTYVAAHLYAQLLRDSRVRGIETLEFLMDGDGAGIDVQVVPFLGDRVQIIAPLAAP